MAPSALNDSAAAVTAVATRAEDGGRASSCRSCSATRGRQSSSVSPRVAANVRGGQPRAFSLPGARGSVAAMRRPVATPRSSPANAVQLMTDATLRSATLNLSPRRYSRPRSAPSNTPNGPQRLSLAGHCGGVALLLGEDAAMHQHGEQRRLDLGHRPEAPLKRAALVGHRRRPQLAGAVLARQIEVDGH